MADRYTKIVLTVIAFALVALVAQQAVPRAGAQGLECGSIRNPCHIAFSRGETCGSSLSPCYVRLER